MSLVGLRPCLPREYEKMGKYRKTILKALPGIAGLLQVSGKNELRFEDRLRLGEYYAGNSPLWPDSAKNVDRITRLRTELFHIFAPLLGFLSLHRSSCGWDPIHLVDAGIHKTSPLLGLYIVGHRTTSEDPLDSFLCKAHKPTKPGQG